MTVHFGVEERLEEPEALDVVEVQVGQEQVDLRRTPSAAICMPERADAGARVEDDEAAAERAHLDATSCCRRSAPSPAPGRRE